MKFFLEFLRQKAPRQGKDPNLVLVRFHKNGGPEMELRVPLYVYDGDGYSREILALYERL